MSRFVTVRPVSGSIRLQSLQGEKYIRGLRFKLEVQAERDARNGDKRPRAAGEERGMRWQPDSR
jgi:hypothetical protein